ncbi:hypothetical protein [Desulfovibrio inopinatus]|uniref:hypothetical protein n=1 Tax=Desulfovibrio inopinatus TaxID=102109 RepID=UPI00040FEA3D|nr:hypothetical protein [Desulfovibrio inopinatus]
MPNRATIAGEIAKCSLLFPKRSNAELEALTALWGEALDDLTDDELVFACAMARKRCKFWPTPAELLEFHEKTQSRYEATYIPLPESPEVMAEIAQRNAERARTLREALATGIRPDWVGVMEAMDVKCEDARRET